MRSEAGVDDHDPELEQPLVQAENAPAVPSATTQIMQHPAEAGTGAVRTTGIEDRCCSHQPEAEPATPLEDARMRRNPVRTAGPGDRLVGHLRSRTGSGAASSVAERERSRSRFWEAMDLSSGREQNVNLPALIARAGNARERGKDDGVDGAECFIKWQASWSERM